MDYILSVTGSGARVVRDAITQKLWPGHGQETVQSPQPPGGSTYDGYGVLSKTGQCSELCWQIVWRTTASLSLESAALGPNSVGKKLTVMFPRFIKALYWSGRNRL